MIKLLRTPSDTCLSYWVTGMSWSCGPLTTAVLRWLSLSYSDGHLWLLSHGGVVPGCVLGEKLGFNPVLYLSVSWFVVAQRRAVIAHYDCNFPPLANVYLWDLAFLLHPKLSHCTWQRIVPCFPTFSWWNSSLFFFPQFSMWELNTGTFCLFGFPPL